ncbi:LacI family transcriptional regulator [Rothia nasimurium]|uniref:LacI family transcriptional regulator n=2 Tax=Rothia nasimurium TaxID=85336 RepID=A0A4Y9F2C0_9MICC|nr:LacI family transcriptional regulator [Rothia nasimurium]
MGSMTTQYSGTPAQPSKRATIIDVAARAGVSKSLVSLAFKDPQRVSDARLKLIRTAASELNYSPSFVAQSLTSQQSPFIGILVLDFQNPLFIEVADAVRRTLVEYGEFGLLLNGSSTATVSEPYGTLDPQVLRMLHSLRPRALVVVGTAADQNALPADIPVVYVSAAITRGVATCIRADDEAGMELLVEHLVTAGHQRLGYITGSSGAVTQERQAAFESSVSARDLEFLLLPGDYTEQGGYRAGQNLLTLPEEQRPTAVIAVNDIAALGFMRAVEEAGLTVPDDVAVAGFDNIFLAGIPRVGLTSVDPNKDELGRQAALAALAGAKGEVDEAQYLLVEPILVIRASSTGSLRYHPS